MAASLLGGAAIGAAFGEVLKAILSAKEKAAMFKPTLDRIEFIVGCIIPVVEETSKWNKVLNRRRDETEKLMERIMEGKKLLLECSKVRWYANWKKPKFTDKLRDFEESLKTFFAIVVEAQQARDITETLFEVKDMHADLKRLILNTGIGGFKGFSRSYAIPGPPEDFVGMEVPLWELKMMLFKDEVSTLVLSAPPGCGKTTLAKLFCHDKVVQEKFQDNIFFVIVSRNPTMEGLVQRLFEQKCYQVPGFQSQDVVYHLEQFLRSIAPDPILLVLDDVWPESLSIIDKFNIKIPGYKVLVTSRSHFPRFDCTYKLKPLNDENAMILFRRSASLPNQNSEIADEVVDKIVKGCKGFPMALNVVGRSLREEPKEVWQLREIQLSETGSIFEYDDLINCLKGSLDALDKKVKVKECFMDLCSFPEDQRIPVTCLIDIWAELYGQDDEGMRAIATLWELSSGNLLDLIIKRKDLGGSYSQYFVMQHDLLRELAIHLSNLEPIENRERVTVDIIGNNLPDWLTEGRQLSLKARLLSIFSGDKFPSKWCMMEVPKLEALVLNFRTQNYTLPDFILKSISIKVIVLINYGFFPAELSNFENLRHLFLLKRIRMEKVILAPFSFTSMNLPSLRKLTLVMCTIGQAFTTSTFRLPDSLANLEEIDIDYSYNLTVLPVELCLLARLKKLSITNCPKLTTLPKEISNWVALEVLRLSSLDIVLVFKTIGMSRVA
ncbi:hypothetical protein K2173_006090 [Erythroxylum novogranatense]|uniref:RPW8 domain-containing protein n=1 Tax=Erythroxylum novogranatense TaxID=1862640 RepID=A0AAV8TC76_9ROSI|nr:hypothetical protein K2173_006090 [Erythroxylum novogranatense]